jgi:hypothetical protein
MIQLGDHLVDSLRDVLAQLVRVEQLTFQRADALELGLQLSPQLRVLPALRTTRLCERIDRPLEAIEIIDVPSVVRNRSAPLDQIVPTMVEGRQVPNTRITGSSDFSPAKSEPQSGEPRPAGEPPVSKAAMGGAQRAEGERSRTA